MTQITQAPVRGTMADGEGPDVITFGEIGGFVSHANAARRSDSGVVAVQVAQSGVTTAPAVEITLSAPSDIPGSAAWSAVTLTNGVVQILHPVTAIRITRSGDNTNDCTYTIAGK